MNNLERYKDDLTNLIDLGARLGQALQGKSDDEETSLDDLPSFADEYQGWYSEATALLRQVLPDRRTDFQSLYVGISNHLLRPEKLAIFDSLTNDLDQTTSCFRQQLAIVGAARRRFDSSLFDIKQLVRADLFDSELEAAKELIKHGFLRASGAVAGVVMEKHLAQVCENHSVTTRRKPTISNLNDALKSANVIETPQWRRNQHLGDLRNLCDHNNEAAPTKEQVTELVDGVMSLTKTLY